MPTENRSSNTEMVSVPREDIEAACARFAKAQIFDFSRRMRALLDHPAPQPHPEPIAWMVGTAIWWTKEEAERDAAATGLPIVGLGPMPDTSELEQLVAANTEYARRHLEQLDEAERLRAENEKLREVIKHSDSNIQRQSLRISNQRAQLAEQDALLHKLKETIQREYWDEYAGLEETRELIEAAISASTEKGPKS
ncbi:hypothetical protein PAGU2196_11120 [Pseudomonas sp. PAGU 2196]|uniref:hypothetical protein n=1 Tax=Pseudomonas sp. PAGU 2196 TaxID=2793997 RepID=UPI001EE0A942|nr:hypothetical protein [Pseudomonas sp. PAGU 2196]GHS80278.1 hypothetical protein PAGU2196_11120 [Pseudomonas sp. PAGU 2196]